MTKPQFAPEPSMEDILSSIRKMISEDRLEARPVPDQIAGTPFGDRSASESAAKSEKPEKKETQAEASPPTSPAVHEVPKPAETSAAKPASSAAPASPERSSPSFSSLSDALKSAAPDPKRGTLDDRVADMLEDEKAPVTNGRPAVPSTPAATPLAVFAASQSSTPPKPEPRTGAVPPTQGRPAMRAAPPVERSAQGAGQDAKPAAGPARNPFTPLNGPAPRAPAPQDPSASKAAPAPAAGSPRPFTGKLGQPSLSGARRDEPLARPSVSDVPRMAPAASAPGTSKMTARSATGETKPETQRVITMPARYPGASATGEASAAPKGAGTNGTSASMRGVRPAPQGIPPRPPAAAPGETAKAPAKPPAAAGSVGIGVPPETGKAPSENAKVAASDAAAPASAVKEPGEALRALKESIAESAAGPEPAGAKAEDKGAIKTPGTNQPSEALVDAVVDLVHSQPGVLSVFTSGDAFIHGVGAHGDDENPFVASEQKLDRSAAELLRPMLRQWLAANMPRIVEEALRSELTSGQGTDKDAE